MKQALKDRRRVLAMRQTQLRIATGEISAARGAEASLEQKQEHLRALAIQMHESGSRPDMGRSLHAQMELAQRLRQAGDSMANAIDGARQRTAQAERQRVAAYQDREIADRLADRSARQLENELQRRAANQPASRRRTLQDNDT